MVLHQLRAPAGYFGVFERKKENKWIITQYMWWVWWHTEIFSNLKSVGDPMVVEGCLLLSSVWTHSHSGYRALYCTAFPPNLAWSFTKKFGDPRASMGQGLKAQQKFTEKTTRSRLFPLIHLFSRFLVTTICQALCWALETQRFLQTPFLPSWILQTSRGDRHLSNDHTKRSKISHDKCYQGEVHGNLI